MTQAIGSFMDNLFKMLTVFYLSGPLGLPLGKTLATATFLLVVPFIFLSNLAGALADRYSKTTLIRIVKGVELALLLLAFPAYYSGAAWPMLAVLALLASQSAFFGPLKRGIIPEVVPGNAVTEANGLMSATSYLGIIAGMVLPSLLCSRLGVAYEEVLAVAVGISVTGLFASFKIPATEARRRPMSVSVRVVSDTVSAFRGIRSRPKLLQAALGAVAFSGLAALFQQVLVIFAKENLGMSVEEAGFPFLFVAGGIIVGAVLAGRYGQGEPDAGCVPVGAFFMTLGLLCIPFASSMVLFYGALAVVGLGGGFCMVPLNTYLQTGSDADRRGEILGASETASFGAIVFSAALVVFLTDVAGFTARGLVWATAFFSVLALIWALSVLPVDAFRFFLTRLVRIFYNVRVEGLENLPKNGGVLLAMNHTAFVDAPIIQSVTQRCVRFVMSREVFTNWKWCRPVFRLDRAILIHTTDNAKALVRSICSAREALVAGDAVAIYPEGELSRTGRIEEFRPGFEKMVKGTNAPVVPIYIGNLWGSIFSFAKGNPGLHFPRHWRPRKVLVRIGAPLPTTATASEVRAAILDLGTGSRSVVASDDRP